jgi:hypothetical protein
MDVDYLIIGDGISGLLLLQRILSDKRGSVLLISPTKSARSLRYSNSQTYWCQGILHRGYKYSLEGHARPELDRYADRFVADLSGIVDFSSFVLSDHVKILADSASHFPNTVKTSSGHYFGDRVKVGIFPEQVIDSWSLAKTLRLQLHKSIHAAELQSIEHKCGVISKISLSSDRVIKPKHVFMCAGHKNASIWHNMMSMPVPVIQQVRPVVVGEMQHSNIFDLHAHILFNKKWALTINSLKNVAGDSTWRLGGPLFDSSVSLSCIKEETYKIISHFFGIHSPSMTLRVTGRAEKNADGARVLRPRRFKAGNVTIGWPVKMVMAPVLVDKMLRDIS